MKIDNSLIDFDKLISFWGDDPEIQQEMFDIYITDVPEYLTNLKEAFKQQDFKEIYRYAHCIKGASLATAILVIPDQCSDIETLAQNANIEGINELILAIETTFENVKNLIIKILN